MIVDTIGYIGMLSLIFLILKTHLEFAWHSADMKGISPCEILGLSLNLNYLLIIVMTLSIYYFSKR